MPVTAIAEIFGLSGRLLDVLTRTEQRARRQPGARRYALAARLDAPDELVLVSEWDSYEAMASYHRSEEFARYQFELDGLIARPSEMTIYSVSDTVRPVPSGPLDPRDPD